MNENGFNHNAGMSECRYYGIAAFRHSGIAQFILTVNDHENISDG